MPIQCINCMKLGRTGNISDKRIAKIKIESNLFPTDKETEAQ